MAASHMASTLRAAGAATVLILVYSAAVLWNGLHEVVLLNAGLLHMSTHLLPGLEGPGEHDPAVEADRGAEGGAG